jgi:hypothetical protein
MGLGLANALLISSREAFKDAAAIDKVTTPGFLQYLLGNNKPNIISDYKDDGTGYLRDIKIRFRQRGVPGQSITTDNCTMQTTPAYLEQIVPTTAFRALGMCFDDAQIDKFEKDALSVSTVGGFTPVMKDVYETIIEKANGLFADINNDLLAVQVASFGKNISTGNNAAKTINFPLPTTTNPLTQGMLDIMNDAMINEVRLNGACIVGSGLINNYYLQQAAIANIQGNMAGVNTSMLAMPKLYFDPYAQAAWGANQFGLFEKNAVQFVNTCRFQGIKAGQKGSDYFTTMYLPITDSLGQASLGGFKFDVQITYRTCPGTVTIGGVPTAMGRGYNIILSCSYQTVNIPANSYAAGDRLNLVNGTYRYTATNV